MNPRDTWTCPGCGRRYHEGDRCVVNGKTCGVRTDSVARSSMVEPGALNAVVAGSSPAAPTTMSFLTAERDDAARCTRFTLVLLDEHQATAKPEFSDFVYMQRTAGIPWSLRIARLILAELEVSGG